MKQEYKGPFAVVSSALVVIATLFFYQAIWKPSPQERFTEYLEQTTLVEVLITEIVIHQNKFSGDRFPNSKEIPSSIKDILDEVFPDMKLHSIDLDYKTECSKPLITISLDRWTFQFDPCASERPLYTEQPVTDGFFEYYQIDKNWSAYVDNDPI